MGLTVRVHVSLCSSSLTGTVQRLHCWSLLHCQPEVGLTAPAGGPAGWLACSAVLSSLLVE